MTGGVDETSAIGGVGSSKENDESQEVDDEMEGL